jgi:hypothetical protein
LAKVIIVGGFEGTGKSSALRHMNPNDTYVYNTLGKDLPFKGSRKLYNTEIGNTFTSDNWQAALQCIPAVADKGYSHLVIDDIGYLMSTEFFQKADQKGYDKFNEIGLHMQQIIKAAKDSELETVTLMFHLDNDPATGIALRTIGRLLMDKYNPAGLVEILLVTNVDTSPDGTSKYTFVTNRCMKNGLVLPAKSPMGMFDLEIDNDLNFVIEKMNEYYV